MQIISTVTSKFQATIPLSIRKTLGLQSGDKILFRKNGEKIEIERVKFAENAETPSYQLDELLANFSPETLHNFVDSGAELGKEKISW